MNAFLLPERKNATQLENTICAAYYESAVAKSNVRNWFARFRAGDFHLEDEELSGRPSIIDVDMITTLTRNYPNSEKYFPS